ncbi:hypothetical protein CRYUN_Cryun33cG0000600 [Craigia yunnanensis]
MEAHFADAKFYLESTFVKDVQSVLDEMKQSKYNEKNLASSSSEENEISQGLKDLILPLTNLDDSKVFKPPLKGFVRPVEEALVEHGDLLSHRVKGFDPNVYRLLVKVGYTQEDVSKLTCKIEEPTEEKLIKPIKIHQVWRKKYALIPTSRHGLGFSPLKLKIHKKTSRYINVEEFFDDHGNSIKPPRSSVFNRLGVHATQSSVFDRLSAHLPRKFVFECIRGKCIEAPKLVFVHLRLGKQNFKKVAHNKKKKAPKLDFSNDVHSKIPSQMRRQSKWVVTTGEALKAKKHTIVMTKQISFLEE